jgi:hypothetical protein
VLQPGWVPGTGDDRCVDPREVDTVRSISEYKHSFQSGSKNDIETGPELAISRVSTFQNIFLFETSIDIEM